MSSNAEGLDLLLLHGRDQLVLDDVFATCGEFRFFVEDYAFNQNKRVKQRVKCGNLRRWGCIVEACKWEVEINKRTAQRDADTKLAGIPPGSWFVKKVCNRHTSCDTIQRRATARQLGYLRGLQSAVVDGLGASKARVVHSLKVNSNVNMEDRAAVVYRAVTRAKEQLQTDDDYALLPSFLLRFEDRNPGSRACCQLDDQGRFFRSFLLIGSIVKGQAGWMPVLQSDGTHMSHDRYNGVCLTLISTDGDGKNIPVAVGYVPSETVDNFVWFLANCIVGGVTFYDRPLFVDRGKQRGAQEKLLALGYLVNLKFCSHHIVTNVRDRFRGVISAPERVKTYVMQLQKATNIAEYEDTLAEITAVFPETRSVLGKNGKRTQQTVSQYLALIHPVSWTRFGNFKHTSTELEYLQGRWKNSLAFGVSVPLFGVRTTSANEGENKAMLYNGARSEAVLLSTLAFVERANLVIARKQQTSREWNAHNYNMTPTAKAKLKQQAANAATYTVNACAGSGTIFEVIEPKTSLRTAKLQRIFRVDTGACTCSRCWMWEQRQIPCCHLLAAFARTKNPNRSIKELFQAAYSTDQYDASFSKVTIELPLMSELQRENTIRSPPIYRQSGSARRRSEARDRGKNKRRIPSRGEIPPTAAAAVPKTMPSASSMDGFLQDLVFQVTAAERKKRSPYKCSFCGKAGHNKLTCPRRVEPDAPAGSDIIGGRYVVGSCPIELLRVSAQATETAANPDFADSTVV